jgi:hypothetical protein
VAPEPAKPAEDEVLEEPIIVECPHTDLGPHWENAADMGQHDKITGYKCGGCLRMFSVDEYQELMATEATRLAWMKEQPPADAPDPTASPEAPPSTT